MSDTWLGRIGLLVSQLDALDQLNGVSDKEGRKEGSIHSVQIDWSMGIIWVCSKVFIGRRLHHIVSYRIISFLG